MREEQDQHAEGVKQSIESIIGTNTVLRRKKKSEEDINKETFEKIIRTIEEIQVRSALLHSELGLDYANYDEKFYEIIDNLIVMYFGKEASELIFYYIYERISPNGSINELIDQNDQVVPLNNVNDLWVLVNHIKNKTNKIKKK